MTLADQAIQIVVRIHEIGYTDDISAAISALAPKLAKKPEPPTEEEKAAFERFRLEYKRGGSVSGFQVEFDKFRKQKDWREVLPSLIPNLSRQRTERKTLLDRNEFVPDWQRLSTYINQRGWERIFCDLPTKVESDLPSKYLEWLRTYTNQHVSFVEVVRMAMTMDQITAWNQEGAPFRGISKVWGADKKKQMLAQAHGDYFTNSYLRSKHQNVGLYLVELFRKDISQ